MSTDRSWWLINVAGYGKFAFFGTHDEAEERLIAKRDWEGSPWANMRPVIASARSEVQYEIRRLKQHHEQGIQLEPNELEAIGVTPK